MNLNTLLEKKSYHNASTTTIHLLKELKIPVTNTTVIETLEQNPHFPSLLSISESLQKWRINNIALRIKKESLEELPTPFIAHSRKGQGYFMLVNNVNGNIEYLDEKGEKKYKTREDFYNEWSNVVLLAETKASSGDRQFKNNRRNEIIHSLRLPFILTIGVVISILFGVRIFSISPISIPLLLIKLLGAMTSMLLLWFELDKANPTLQHICTAGRKTNCQAV